jgi:hypothetical protein
MAVDSNKAGPHNSPEPENSNANNITRIDSEKFRTIVGITTPRKLKPETYFDHRDEHYNHCQEANEGLYIRVCKRESRRRLEYLVCVFVLDFCYMAQLAFAAILTALGASRSSFIVITVFGALNVAIGGVLALFKGLGLPMRLRKDWLEFQKLRHYIDDRERMFDVGFHAGVEEDKKCGCGCEKCKCGGSKCGCGGHEASKEEKDKSLEADKKDKKESSHLEKEIKKIQKMYDDLMSTVENNQPDFYSSAPASGGSKYR